MSDDKLARERALELAQVAHDKALATDAELKSKLAEAEAQRKQDDEAMEEGGESREELLGAKRLLEAEVEAMHRELATYSDHDPAELEKKALGAAVEEAQAIECTDDIYSMEGWLKGTLGGGEQLDGMLRDMYDREYDEEAGGLRELI